MSAVLTMIIVFLVAGAVFAVSAIGIGGRGTRAASPNGVKYLERAAEHLNGEADAPKALVKLLS